MQTIIRRFVKILPLAAFLAAISPAVLAQPALQSRILQTIDGNSVSPIKGTVHPFARAQYDQGPLDNSKTLRDMTLQFKLSAAQQASLTALLEAQKTPGSPQFHKWLTQGEYAARFGMSPADLNKASEWLSSQGFTVGRTSDSRNAISFSGSVALAERAFHTQIHSYSVNGETHFANSSDIALPNAFAGVVQDIRGLNDFRPQPRMKKQTISLDPRFTSGISGSHFLAPGDFATIYNLTPLYDAGFTGKGQTIGVLGQTSIVMADITNFRAAAGLPTNNPTVVLTGSADPGISYTDLGEADLDLEWSGAVAKDATIVYINASSGNVFDSMLFAIQNTFNGVALPILSVSYGNCEANWNAGDIATLEGAFQQANSQGQTILAASGDSGATDCDFTTTPSSPVTSAIKGLAVDYPASSVYVTALGGSEFTGDGKAGAPDPAGDSYWNSTTPPPNVNSPSPDLPSSAKSYIPEMVWNDTTFSIANRGGLSSAGGGKSAKFTKPSWQTGVVGIPADGARDVPDISLSASADHDPYLVCTQVQPQGSTTYTTSCTTGFRLSNAGQNDDKRLTAFGGTSASTPAFAGILALIEQKVGSAQGNIGQALYTMASNSTTYASAFNDIQSGDNKQPCTSGSINCPSGTTSIGYSATVGYDLASGLGSVNASNMATAWVNYSKAFGTTTAITAAPSNSLAGTSVTLTATVTANNGSSVPTGTVSFSVDGALLVDKQALVANSASTAQATTVTSVIAAGTHTVSATYAPADATFNASTGFSTFTATAGSAVTTTTLTATPASLALGDNIQFTVAVSSATTGAINGEVIFSIGTLTLGSATITNGSAVVSTTASSDNGFSVGSDVITATYTGSAIYAASSGNFTETIAAPPATGTGQGTSALVVTSQNGYSGTVQFTLSVPTGSLLQTNSCYSVNDLPVSANQTATTSLVIYINPSDCTNAASRSRFKINNGTSKLISQQQPTPLPSGATPVRAATVLAGFLLLGIFGRNSRRWMMVLCVASLAAVGAMMGCGGGSGSGGGGGSTSTPAISLSAPNMTIVSSSTSTLAKGTYTATLTGTDKTKSSITSTASFTVTVQ